MQQSFAALTPLSTERKTLARRYLAHSQTFTILKVPDEEEDARVDAVNYEATRQFDSDINGYYRFHIDYTPHFGWRWNLFRPTTWLYFIDINDEVVERKFPRDQDMRSVITAFRYSIVRNRRRIIALKRLIQAIGIITLLLPSIVIAIHPEMAKSPPALLGIVIGAFIITGFAGFYQHMRDSQLKSILESNGRTLASKIQDRANDLNRHFLEFFARIDREELNDDMTNPEWTHRSAWWMKLCMWYPRRIESLEMFLQSEMQRTRIFMLRSAWLGYGSAIVLLIVIPLLAAAIISLMHAPVLLLVWLLWLGGTIASALLTMYSLRTSIGLNDITAAVGKDPLGHNSRFADLDLHNKLAGQIRRDKEGLRQAFLRGGYGENRNRG